MCPPLFLVCCYFRIFAGFWGVSVPIISLMNCSLNVTLLLLLKAQRNLQLTISVNSKTLHQCTYHGQTIFICLAYYQIYGQITILWWLFADKTQTDILSTKQLLIMCWCFHPEEHHWQTFCLLVLNHKCLKPYPDK